MKTFTIESTYRNDGGGRVDVVFAETFEEAYWKAGENIIADNGWEGDEILDPHQWFLDNMEVLHEFEGLEGGACPNCTSHHTTTNPFGKALYLCLSCAFQWKSIGFDQAFRQRLMGKEHV